MRRALLAVALYRCLFDGAIIQRAAAPSSRYARLLRRYLPYPLLSWRPLQNLAPLSPHFAPLAQRRPPRRCFPALRRFEIYLKF